MKIYALFLILYSSFHTLTYAANTPKIQLASNYKNESINITQYWVSEKLDGMRGYWNGHHLYSKNGHKINVPNYFTANWPQEPFDGELWLGRSQFEKTLSCAKQKNKNNACWLKLKFMVFDAPDLAGSFDLRLKKIKSLIQQTQNKHLQLITQFKLSSIEEMHQHLSHIDKAGGEGLMLHHKNALYKVGRQSNLLKVKKAHDAEAIVLEHIEGKGKFTGMMGAIRVQGPSGLSFKIGTGFSFKERKNPPKVGSVITYQYSGKTQKGIPRFARFLRLKHKE